MKEIFIRKAKGFLAPLASMLRFILGYQSIIETDSRLLNLKYELLQEEAVFF